MNKKILLTTLIGICSAPGTKTSDLPSTYPATALLMREVKHYVSTTYDAIVLERATASSHKNTIPGQRHVINLLTNFSNYHTNKALSSEELAQLNEKINANTESIHREFQTDSDSIFYDDLLEATKRYFSNSIRRISFKRDIFEKLPNRIPYMSLAIFEATHSIDDNFISLEDMQQIFDLTVKPEDKTDKPRMYRRTIDIFKKALLIESEKCSSNSDYTIVMKLALILEEMELANQVAYKYLSSPTNYYLTSDNFHRLENIYEIGNQELSNNALKKALSLVENNTTYLHILRCCKENRELITICLEEMLTNKYGNNCYIVLQEAQKIGNTEMANRALEEMLKLANNQHAYCAKLAYSELISLATNIGNMYIANRALERCLHPLTERPDLYHMLNSIRKHKNTQMINTVLEKIFDQAKHWTDYSLLSQTAQEIGNTEMANRALEEMFKCPICIFQLHKICQEATLIENTEMANRALEEMLKLAKDEGDYNMIIRAAQEIGNRDIENRALQRNK